MNNKQIEQRIKNAEQELKKAREELSSYIEDIIVPDCIQFERNVSTGIVFGDRVMYTGNGNLYIDGHVSYNRFKKAKLIKVKQDELKIDQVYFHTDCENVNMKENCLSYYCVYTGNGKYWAISEYYNNIFKGSLKWKHWYKVVEVTE